MNLSPAWVSVLASGGHEALHWSDIGPADALDRVLLEWCGAHEAVLLTHDLDFGNLLASMGVSRPSVIQFRKMALDPIRDQEMVLQALNQFETMLRGGALVTVDPDRMRARGLPLSMQ